MYLIIKRLYTSLFLVLIFFNTCVSNEDLSSLPKPYSEIETLLPYDNHGWYSNATHIEKLVKEYNVKVAVEVGSWLGLSSRHIASILPENGKLYCIDHWLGTDEYSEKDRKKYFPTLYEQFLSNTIHANLCDKIIPIRVDSSDGAQILLENRVTPDLIYIDACHYEESVYNNLKSYYPLIKNRGIICGDDYARPGGAVKRAVHRFANENNLKVIANSYWFWQLREK